MRAGNGWCGSRTWTRRARFAGAADAQLRTLAAFGFVSDGPVLRQSDRGDLYRAALDQLLASGHAFVCHCSRERPGRRAAACIGVACAGARRTDPSIRFRVPDFTALAFDDAIQGRIAQDVSARSRRLRAAPHGRLLGLPAGGRGR